MRRILVFFAGLGCLLALLFSSGEAHAERVVYAIVIGNNRAPVDDAGLEALKYADDDAIRYYELLSRRAKQVALLTVLDPHTQRRHAKLAGSAQPPTFAALKRAVSKLRIEMDRDLSRGDRPELFFVFSGHGGQSPEGAPYLALWDDRLTRARLRAYVIEALPATQIHLVVDACHAGAVVGVRGAFDREVEATRVRLADTDLEQLVEQSTLDNYPNVGVLLATAADQEAHEWGRIESGVFTHEVLSALAGAADVNSDMRIEYSEVEAFVYAANRSVSNPKAVPRIIARAPRSDRRAVLMDLARLQRTVLLVGSPRGLGRFHIELPNGERWLEANLSGEQSAALAVPAERAFLRSDRGEAELIPGRSGRISLDRLRLHKSEVVARGSIDSALRTELFRTAYGPTYYRGFVDSTGQASVPFGTPSSPELDRSSGVSLDTRHILAVGLVALSAAGAVGAITNGIRASDSKSDFDDTDLQRPAYEAKQRFERQRAAAVAFSGLALAAGGGAFLVWPKVKADPTTGVTEASLGFGAAW